MKTTILFAFLFICTIGFLRADDIFGKYIVDNSSWEKRGLRPPIYQNLTLTDNGIAYLEIKQKKFKKAKKLVGEWKIENDTIVFIKWKDYKTGTELSSTNNPSLFAPLYYTTEGLNCDSPGEPGKTERLFIKKE